MFTDVDKKAHSDHGVQQLAFKICVLSEVGLLVCRKLKAGIERRRDVRFTSAAKSKEDACPWLTGRMGLGYSKKLCRISPKNSFSNA